MARTLFSTSKIIWACCFALIGIFALQFLGAHNEVLAGERFIDVRVGGSYDYDACSTIIGVSGLNGGPDSFLALRTGPGSRYPMIAKLRNGTELWFCHDKGRWLGVLVRSSGSDCGVSSPIGRRQPYRGRCLSGWVYGKYTTPIAG